MRPAAIIGALAAAVLAGVGCSNDLDRVAAVDVRQEAPDRVTTGAEYVYSDSGRVRNRLKAGRVSDYRTTPPPRTELEDGVELVFFDRAGRPGSVLYARRAHILPGEKRMEVLDHVVFTNVRGERLETEKLVWEQDSARVHTDRPVKITRANDILYGQGLDASEDFSRYTIRRVTGSLVLDRDTLSPL
jgi:LPS export ABC transporter protein LptC